MPEFPTTRGPFQQLQSQLNAEGVVGQIPVRGKGLSSSCTNTAHPETCRNAGAKQQESEFRPHTKWTAIPPGRAEARICNSQSSFVRCTMCSRNDLYWPARPREGCDDPIKEVCPVPAPKQQTHAHDQVSAVTQNQAATEGHSQDQES